MGAGIESWLVRLDEMSCLKGLACRFGLSGKLAAGLRVWAARGEWKAAVQMIEIDTEAEIDTGPDMEIDGIFTTATYCREPRKIKNFTPTEAYKKTPCGAKGSNKLYIKMTELTQAASY